MNRSRLAPLSRGDRARLVGLHACLVRPVLCERHRARGRQLLGDAGWRPVPRIAATLLVHPLVVHHVEQLGYAEDDAFAPETNMALDPTLRERLVRNDYGRRARLRQVLDDFRDAGIERVMLQKGASIAARWPSPALREMEDLDLVVSRASLRAAERVLLETGWRRRGFSWAFPDGVALDLAAPETALAREIFEGAQPHPVYGDAMKPATPHEMVIVALHAAKHGGARIWKELADLNFLSCNLADAAAIEEAWEIATRREASAPLAALLKTARALDRDAGELPRNVERHDSDQARALCELYRRMMVERISEFHLRTLIQPGALPSLGKAKPQRAAARGGAQRDPLAGEVDRRGRLARQWRKLLALVEIYRSGQRAHYRRLARLAAIGVASRKPFDDK